MSSGHSRSSRPRDDRNHHLCRDARLPAAHGGLPRGSTRADSHRSRLVCGVLRSRAVGHLLPECAYVPTVGRILQEANIRWFVVDAHGLMFGQPKPRFAIYSPRISRPRGRRSSAATATRAGRCGASARATPATPPTAISTATSARSCRSTTSASSCRPTTAATTLHQIPPHHRPGSAQGLYNLGWAAAAADSHAGHFLRAA